MLHRQQTDDHCLATAQQSRAAPPPVEASQRGVSQGLDPYLTYLPRSVKQKLWIDNTVSILVCAHLCLVGRVMKVGEKEGERFNG